KIDNSAVGAWIMAQTIEDRVDTTLLEIRPRILVVDPHEDMRIYLMRVLGEHYDIDAPADASAALPLARDRQADVVVADVTFRADLGCLSKPHCELTGKTPVIFYSTAGDLEIEENDVISPFSERQLMTLVRAHLQVARMRHDSLESLRLSEERFRIL